MNSKLFPSHKAIDPCRLSFLLLVDSGSKTFRFPREGWSVQWNETMSAAANAVTTWPVAANSFCCRDCVLWFVLSSQLISINSTDVTDVWYTHNAYHCLKLRSQQNHCCVHAKYSVLTVGYSVFEMLEWFWTFLLLWCCFFYLLEHEVGFCSFLFHWCLLGGCLLQGTMRAPNRQSKSKGGMWTW